MYGHVGITTNDVFVCTCMCYCTTDTSYAGYETICIVYTCLYTVLSTKRVGNAVFQSLDIFSVMVHVHAIETQDIPT